MAARTLPPPRSRTMTHPYARVAGRRAVDYTGLRSYAARRVPGSGGVNCWRATIRRSLLVAIVSRSAWLMIPLVAAGCLNVHVYQPMTGLYDPVLVDPAAPNFVGRSITIRCAPGDGLDRAEARKLCRNVRTLFENQGATVEVLAPAGGPSSTNPFADAAEAAANAEAAGTGRSDLTVELSARTLNKTRHPVSWILYVASFTVAPGVTESTFAQDVVVRDATGFLLAQETLVGKMVKYSGVGTYLGNVLLDYTLREKDERLVMPGPDGRPGYADLSLDLYRHLSQTVFDADLRRQVLAGPAYPEPVAAAVESPPTPEASSLPGLSDVQVAEPPPAAAPPDASPATPPEPGAP